MPESPVYQQAGRVKVNKGFTLQIGGKFVTRVFAHIEHLVFQFRIWKLQQMLRVAEL